MYTDAQTQSCREDLAIQSPDLVTVPRQRSHVLQDSRWLHADLHPVAWLVSIVKSRSRKLSREYSTERKKENYEGV